LTAAAVSFYAAQARDWPALFRSNFSPRTPSAGDADLLRFRHRVALL
jgi:hypothetical protein